MAKPKPKTEAAEPAPVTPAQPARRTRAVKAKPEQPPPPPPAPMTKLQTLASLLQRKQGATVEQLMAATGWQAHSVRGALAGAMKVHFGAKVIGEKVDGVRVYRAPQT